MAAGTAHQAGPALKTTTRTLASAAGAFALPSHLDPAFKRPPSRIGAPMIGGRFSLRNATIWSGYLSAHMGEAKVTADRF
jgi:hypothetical protein